MLVLGIESTCDETAIAVVRDGKEILSNTVATQIDLHATYGGVVPELACRRHIDVIIPVLEQSLKEAGITLEAIDAVAVAHCPGLIGALLVGINTAKGLALMLGKPLIGVNHIEAHLYAAIMSAETPVAFPALGVVISGGHTALVKIHDLGQYEPLGQTVDDAVGESFDKVAKMLGLPYPGGPAIENLAKEGCPEHYPFKAGTVKGRPLDFSYSGLKTKVLYTIQGQNCRDGEDVTLQDDQKAHLAASFQRAALGDIVSKSQRALTEANCQSIILGGGVANNRRLREMFAEALPHTPILWPAPRLSLDNGAMIAGLGYHVFQRQGQRCSGMALGAFTRESLDSVSA
jgi:N6-L-threonylcarbamoyladenine synthase